LSLISNALAVYVFFHKKRASRLKIIGKRSAAGTTKTVSVFSGAQALHGQPKIDFCQ